MPEHLFVSLDMSGPSFPFHLSMAPKAKQKNKPLLKGKDNKKKPALRKGEASQPPLRKGTPMKVKKSLLKKSNLQRLGKNDPQKIAKAGEGADTPEEAAQELKSMMDKQEHSRAWSKHQTYIKTRPKAEQKELQPTAAPLIKGQNGCQLKKCLSCLGEMNLTSTLPAADSFGEMTHGVGALQLSRSGGRGRKHL